MSITKTYKMHGNRVAAVCLTCGEYATLPINTAEMHANGKETALCSACMKELHLVEREENASIASAERRTRKP